MAGTTVNPYRFGGQVGYRRDGTNRNYVRARELDTQRGRWISRDPIGFGAGDWNIYRYVFNNPVGMIDPNGTDCVSDPPGGNPYTCSGCGPDVAGSLLRAESKIYPRWKMWNFSKKNQQCKFLLESNGWDVKQLFDDPPNNLFPDCAVGSNCKNTVFAFGGCYCHWTVNYHLYGYLMSLCNEVNPVIYNPATMAAYIKLYKCYFGDGGLYCVDAPIDTDMARFGYSGGRGTPPDPNKPSCGPCGHIDNRTYSIQWGDEIF